MAAAPMTDAEMDSQFLLAALPYWHPVARSEDISARPTRVALLGRELVVWRAAGGIVACLEDRCPHRGTRLSDGCVDAGGFLHCPYHAWGFASDGSCVDIPQARHVPIPAAANAEAHRVDEHAGLVWVCLVPYGEERRARPSFDEAESAEWFRYVGPPMLWRCQATRQIENFCDVAHFSVLHTDTFGNPDAVAMDPYEVDRTGEPWRLAFTYPYCAVDPTAPVVEGERRPTAPIEFSYRLELPFAVWLGGAHGPGSALIVATAPVTATSCRLFWISTFQTTEPVDTDQLLAIEEKIWEADRAIVESQRPVRLLAEHHTAHLPFDRLSVAYRRAMAALGFGPESPP